MKERLSTSQKEKLKQKLSNNWEVPTSSLLEKLSSEISSNFKWEKNPWIYKESVKKLLKLKEKIDSKQDITDLEGEINKLSSHLSTDKKQEFLLAIKWAKEILKNSQDLIWDIKDEINIFSPKTWDFTTKLFWQKNISKALNPQNITDEIIGWWIWLFNSAEAVTKITVNILIWIWKTIPDMYKILSGKGKYDWFKDV